MIPAIVFSTVINVTFDNESGFASAPVPILVPTVTVEVQPYKHDLAVGKTSSSADCRPLHPSVCEDAHTSPGVR
jgi:hypothetical protein